jgi:hypothetical protein
LLSANEAVMNVEIIRTRSVFNMMLVIIEVKGCGIEDYG